MLSIRARGLVLGVLIFLSHGLHVLVLSLATTFAFSLSLSLDLARGMPRFLGRMRMPMRDTGGLPPLSSNIYVLAEHVWRV